MEVTTIHHAKTNLSRLIERAERGEEIVIARGKRPVVRLVPVDLPATKRKPGAFKAEFEMRPEFFDPLPADEMEGWE
jgi:prevent-host-death family protein